MPFEKGNRFGAHPNPHGGRKRHFDEVELKGVIDSAWKLRDRKAAIRKLVDLWMMESNLKALELLLSYAYGKPRQMIEHSGGVSFENLETWEDIEAYCLETGINPAEMREECRRLIESAETDDEESEGAE